jgi:glutathione peroxidase-family protein
MFGIGGGGRHEHQLNKPDEFYSLTCKTLSSDTYSFNQLKGKVVLITNTASFCLAAPRNFRQLAELDHKYREQGLVVLAFPCNQFYAQEYKEPGDTLKCTRKYGVEFTVMEMIEVNGEVGYYILQTHVSKRCWNDFLEVRVKTLLNRRTCH